MESGAGLIGAGERMWVADPVGGGKKRTGQRGGIAEEVLARWIEDGSLTRSMGRRSAARTALGEECLVGRGRDMSRKIPIDMLL